MDKFTATPAMPGLRPLPDRFLLWVSLSSVYVLMLHPLWAPLRVDAATLVLFGTAIYCRGYSVLWSFYRVPFYLFCALMLLDAVSAALLKRSLLASLHLFKGLLLFVPALLFVLTTTAQRRLQLVRGLLLVSGLVYAMVLFAVLTSDVESNSYRRMVYWSSLYLGNLHNFTNTLTISLLASLLLLCRDTELRWRLVALFMVGLCGALFVIVQSEGAVIALLVVLAGVVMLYRPGIWRWLAAAGLVALVVVLHLFYLQPELMQQLLSLRMQSFDERVALYNQLVSAWQQQPWLGWGMGSYKFMPVSLLEGNRYLYPHHLYLEALYSLGVVGVLLLLAMLLTMCRYIQLETIRRDPLALLAFMVLCFVAGKGMTDMKLISTQMFSVIAIGLGLMSRLPQEVFAGSDQAALQKGDS